MIWDLIQFDTHRSLINVLHIRPSSLPSILSLACNLRCLRPIKTINSYLWVKFRAAWETRWETKKLHISWDKTNRDFRDAVKTYVHKSYPYAAKLITMMHRLQLLGYVIKLFHICSDLVIREHWHCSFPLWLFLWDEVSTLPLVEEGSTWAADSLVFYF